MDTKTYEYEDPTGGGDDAELILPACFQPPQYLNARDVEGNAIIMDLVGEKEE